MNVLNVYILQTMDPKGFSSTMNNIDSHSTATTRGQDASHLREELPGLRRATISLLCAAFTFAPASDAADLTVSLRGAPEAGSLVFQIYDDADAFGRFRDPSSEILIPSKSDGQYLLKNVGEGELALLVYFDENDNGALDRNFIGIPRELIGLSNNYRPKGPPSFDRASLSVTDDTAIEVEMFRVLGKRGQIGVGLGVIGRGSPYVNSTESVSQVIPTIAYIGDRLQWLGPEINVGLFGSDTARLGLTASYRVGAYEADDSPLLADLGDRESTLLAGLGIEFDLPRGFELEAAYRHDALDRIGGGIAELALSRGFQAGIVRISPEMSLAWTSSDISNHEYGVPEDAARPDRPAYAPGSTTTFGLGVGSSIELTENWRAFVSVTGEILDSKVRKSPIVEDDTVVAGFAALTYAF
jgi:outer membrane protein